MIQESFEEFPVVEEVLEDTEIAELEDRDALAALDNVEWYWQF